MFVEQQSSDILFRQTVYYFVFQVLAENFIMNITVTLEKGQTEFDQDTYSIINSPFIKPVNTANTTYSIAPTETGLNATETQSSEASYLSSPDGLHTCDDDVGKYCTL